MKKFKTSNLLLILFTLVGCNGNTSSNVKVSSSTNEISFTNKIEANLVEGEDYIDHEKLYGTKDLEYNKSMWYINNLDKVPLPDPHVFEEDGKYYIVGTNDAGQCKYVDCYYTTDFVTFEFASKIFNPATYNGWENKENPTIYAPEIFKVDGYYYMYYSAKENTKAGTRRNSVVRSENVLGPYEPIIEGDINGQEAPLFNYDVNRGLDTTLFIDDNCDISINEDQNVIVIAEKVSEKAEWTSYKGAMQTNWELHVIYWNSQTSMLYINSTVKGISDEIATALFPSAVRVKGERVFKSLYGINRLMLGTVGLKSAIDGPIRYKMFAGITPIKINGEMVNQDPVLYLINTRVVQEMFFSILILSFILLVIFTIFAITKM